MKIFATKYALSVGIEEFDGIVYDNTMVTRKTDNWHVNSYHGEGKDWHRTREDAVKRANKMRVAKIATLKKQIVKLESAIFE